MFIIINQLNNTNSLSPDEIDDLLLQKDFGFQRLSPYIKDLIARMIGKENVIQNTLRKDRAYDN